VRARAFEANAAHYADVFGNGRSELPLGLIQTWVSVQQGYWHARSPELLTHPLVSLIEWLRIPGDTLFALGALAFVLFVAALRRPSLE
jgi:nitric oxide reductase subunit B